ncbi:hypothetical protein [Stella sp.]|uniref:hypothetical protein n=1 Tax=Stella sp. TaxID=2912054 RepID=UPI0035B36699
MADFARRHAPAEGVEADRRRHAGEAAQQHHRPAGPHDERRRLDDAGGGEEEPTVAGLAVEEGDEAVPVRQASLRALRAGRVDEREAGARIGDAPRRQHRPERPQERRDQETRDAGGDGGACAAAEGQRDRDRGHGDRCGGDPGSPGAGRDPGEDGLRCGRDREHRRPCARGGREPDDGDGRAGRDRRCQDGEVVGQEDAARSGEDADACGGPAAPQQPGPPVAHQDEARQRQHREPADLARQRRRRQPSGGGRGRRGGGRPAVGAEPGGADEAIDGVVADREFDRRVGRGAVDIGAPLLRRQVDGEGPGEGDGGQHGRGRR